MSLILIKYVYKENEIKVKFLFNNFYTHRTSMIYDECNNANTNNIGASSSLSGSLKSLKRKNRKNLAENPKPNEKPIISQSKSDEVTLNQIESQPQAQTTNLIGYRELPVDCPLGQLHMNDKLAQSGSFSDEAIVEKARRDASFSKEQYEHLKRILSSNSIEKSSNEIFDEILLRDGNNNIFIGDTSDISRTSNNLRLTRMLASSRRVFLRNSSLSTISEEKSLTTLSPTSLSSFTNTSNELSSDAQSTTHNGLHVVQTLLNEFHDKNILINEILHVFEPSSKGGTFNRNIPIRLTSPDKLEQTHHDNSYKSAAFSGSLSPHSPLYTSALTNLDRGRSFSVTTQISWHSPPQICYGK